MSFSFGRALQNGAVSSWEGKDANVEVSQKNLTERAKGNWSAVNGKEYNAQVTKKDAKVDKEAHDY